MAPNQGCSKDILFAPAMIYTFLMGVLVSYVIFSIIHRGGSIFPRPKKTKPVQFSRKKLFQNLISKTTADGVTLTQELRGSLAQLSQLMMELRIISDDIKMSAVALQVTKVAGQAEASADAVQQRVRNLSRLSEAMERLEKTTRRVRGDAEPENADTSASKTEGTDKTTTKTEDTDKATTKTEDDDKATTKTEDTDKAVLDPHYPSLI